MTHTDPSADAFMRCILANPADPVPRLVFADWLEESGKSSNLAWARFLRLADELANAPTNDPRQPKMADELERVGSLVRAKLTYRAEVFVAYPRAMQRVLPLRNMVLNLDTLLLPQRVAELIPSMIAHERLVLPLTVCGSALAVAAPEPDDANVRELLRFVLSRDVLLIRAAPEQLRSAAARHYQRYEYPDGGGRYGNDAAPTAVVEGTPLILRPLGDDAPVVRLVDHLLREAIQLRVSALEIAPRLERTGLAVQVWHHFPGERRPWDPLPSRLLPVITARLRTLADIAPVLQPVQTGVIPLFHHGLSYRLPVRITATPTGPHVHVTIPPSPADPPAVVVNPAA
jgi:uncharacterized protein (TIGR02996 family)